MIVSSNEKTYKIWHLLDSRFSPKMNKSVRFDVPFQVIHESSEKLHASFVTALEYVRLNFEDYLIVSGDALGQAVVCHYEFMNGNLIGNTLVKQFQANDTKIKVAADRR